MAGKTDVKWPKGNEPFYKDVVKFNDRIFGGCMVVIDPASGSSSNPGYAIFSGGKLKSSGDVDVDKRLRVNERLQVIYDHLSKLTKNPDILLIEKLRGRMAPASLMFSVGTAMSAVRSPICIEVPVCVWHAYAGRQYLNDKKLGITTDAQDAEMIGLSVVELALWGNKNEAF